MALPATALTAAAVPVSSAAVNSVAASSAAVSSGASDPLTLARAALRASAAKVALPLARSQFNAPSHAPEALSTEPDALSLGYAALDAVLPDGGLPWGQVIELCTALPSGATSLSLLACARAQELILHTTGTLPWCAFIDPFSSLYAPGVAEAGVHLEKMVVLRPPLSALSRVSVRLVEAKAFAVVVIDACSQIDNAAPRVAQRDAQVALSQWPNVVRRLNVALAGTHSLVILLTDQNSYRPLPLPVGMRLELSCPDREQLKVRVAKERHGRVAASRIIRSFK